MAQVDTGLPWQLKIHGEGPERTRLEDLIASLGLDAQIALRGYTTEPLAALREADIFVLPSRHEGLGNALIEALACGIQVVASDCPHGPREILKGGRLGLLVPPENPSALAAAISSILTGGNHVDPELLRNRAQDFTVAVSYAHWLEVLKATST